jgi:hypothetical protein
MANLKECIMETLISELKNLIPKKERVLEQDINALVLNLGLLSTFLAKIGK